LEGDFPRWHALFPSPEDVICTIQADRACWTETLKRVALVLPRNSPVRLHLDAAGQRLVFHAGTGDDAQAVDEIPADITGDENLEVAFNPGFLADALASFDADTLRASLTTATRPVLFTSAADSGTDAGHLHLLMPIKLQA
jgi:DNA polymerase-3 subunit beta